LVGTLCGGAGKLGISTELVVDSVDLRFLVRAGAILLVLEVDVEVEIA
jgi:hypothetical protein